MVDNKFFGKVWKFLVKFDQYSRCIESSDGDEGIKEGLFVLLSTAPGERFMEPEYGCDLSPLAFKRMSLSLETQMANDIKKAIKTFEPRVDVNKVYIKYENEIEGCIKIIIDYKVIRTDTNYTLEHLYSWNI